MIYRFQINFLDNSSNFVSPNDFYVVEVILEQLEIRTCFLLPLFCVCHLIYRLANQK